MGDFPYNDPDYHRYEGPTLIVRGSKSHYVANDVLPLIGRFFPRFELRDIDCGHWVISEKPEAFRQGKHSNLIQYEDADLTSCCGVLTTHEIEEGWYPYTIAPMIGRYSHCMRLEALRT